jgi:hypothetical protein
LIGLDRWCSRQHRRRSITSPESHRLFWHSIRQQQGLASSVRKFNRPQCHYFEAMRRAGFGLPDAGPLHRPLLRGLGIVIDGACLRRNGCGSRFSDGWLRDRRRRFRFRLLFGSIVNRLRGRI